MTVMSGMCSFLFLRITWIAKQVTGYDDTGLSYTMKSMGFTLGFLSPSNSSQGNRKIFLGSLNGFSDRTRHYFVTSEEKELVFYLENVKTKKQNIVISLDRKLQTDRPAFV